MKKFNTILLFGLVATLATAMGACTDDDDVVEPVRHNSNKISYGVVAEKMSRSTDYTTATFPDEFYVHAVYNSTSQSTHVGKYFDFTTVTKANNWESDKEWPNYTPLDFRALAGIPKTVVENNITEATSGVPSLGYTVSNVDDTNYDLLYAVKMHQTQPNREDTDTDELGDYESKVNLAFRHALTKLVVKAQVTTSDYVVQIKSITWHNMRSTGTMSFPSVDTDASGTCSWSGQGTNIDFTYTFPDSAPTGYNNSWGGSLIAYNRTGFDDTVSANEQFKMLPLKYATAGNYWVTTEPRDDNGSYVTVRCKIFKIVYDFSTGQETYECLWNSDGTKDIYLTNFITLAAGYVTNCTFWFGKSGTPTGYDEDGNSPLTRITYTFSIDDWVEKNTIDVGTGNTNWN